MRVAPLLVLLCLALTLARGAVVPRTTAPGFTATAVGADGKFGEVSLRSELARGRGRWVVLFFFPFAFTFVCPTELLAFSGALPQFDALETSVVAVSTDSHHSLRAWLHMPRDQGGLGGQLGYPLVADIDKSISSAYGVLVENEADPMHAVALRGLFIIDPTGTVRSVQVYDDQVGRSVDETLRVLRGLKHADEHGVVCPSKWTGKAGDATIKPDPELAQAFFSAHGDDL